jgi:hypothetical protein
MTGYRIERRPWAAYQETVTGAPERVVKILKGLRGFLSMRHEFSY